MRQTGVGNVNGQMFQNLYNEFLLFARSEMLAASQYVEIGQTITHERRMAKTKTGLNLFRIVLNEAIVVAKETGLKRIELSARNEGLKEYYSRLGFKFEDPKQPLRGAFTLK